MARAHFCRIIVSTGNNRIAFVGRKSNREICIKVFAYLAATAQELVDVEAKDYQRNFEQIYEWQKPEVRGFKSSFLSGFVNKLNIRFTETKQVLVDEQKEQTRQEAIARRETQIQQALEWSFDAVQERFIQLIDALPQNSKTNGDELALIAEKEVEQEIRNRFEATPLETESTSLMRLDNAKQEVDSWFQERTWGKARSTRTASHNSAGYARGYSRGGQVGLSGNVLH